MKAFLIHEVGGPAIAGALEMADIDGLVKEIIEDENAEYEYEVLSRKPYTTRRVYATGQQFIIKEIKLREPSVILDWVSGHPEITKVKAKDGLVFRRKSAHYVDIEIDAKLYKCDGVWYVLQKRGSEFRHVTFDNHADAERAYESLAMT